MVTHHSLGWLEGPWAQLQVVAHWQTWLLEPLGRARLPVWAVGAWGVGILLWHRPTRSVESRLPHYPHVHISGLRFDFLSPVGGSVD